MRQALFEIWDGWRWVLAGCAIWEQEYTALRKIEWRVVEVLVDVFGTI